MSYSVDPPQLLSVAERLRGCIDDLDEVATSLRRSMDAVAHALARAMPARDRFADAADPRADLAHRLVGRGRAAIAALQSAVLTYVTADEEMAAVSAAGAEAVGGGNPYDPTVFGERRR